MSLDVFLTLPDSATSPDTPEVFTANITHNLNKMAKAAGIYEPLWRPEEVGISRAKQLIMPLTRGLAELKRRKEFYMLLAPSNGWGSYEGLIVFVQRYLEACKEYPTADIVISR